MVVLICQLDAVLEGCRSLKEKRRIVRRLKDSVQGNFKIPVSEVGCQDLWQRALVGFALVGNSAPALNSLMDKIINHIYNVCGVEIIDRRFEFIHFNE